MGKLVGAIFVVEATANVMMKLQRIG